MRPSVAGGLAAWPTIVSPCPTCALSSARCRNTPVERPENGPCSTPLVEQPPAPNGAPTLTKQMSPRVVRATYSEASLPFAVRMASTRRWLPRTILPGRLLPLGRGGAPSSGNGGGGLCSNPPLLGAERGACPPAGKDGP